MKIKWLYTFLSLLTLSLLAGSSAFIFYDGSTSIEQQRSDNEGHLKINSLFINFVSSYKTLINSDYTNRSHLKEAKNKYLLSLEDMKEQAQESDLIHFADLTKLAEKFEALFLKRMGLQRKKDRLDIEVDLSWKKIEEQMVFEVTTRVSSGEEFLPEFKKKLSSWAENIGLLNKLKESIDVSYVNKGEFEEIQELIDLSRWLITFKSEKLRNFNLLSEKEASVLKRIDELNSSASLKSNLKAKVKDYFVIQVERKKTKKTLQKVDLELQEHRARSSTTFEEDIFPKWQEYISERYDLRISERYKRLKKVVTAVSLGGGLIILTMLFVFLKIFPNLKKLEEKAKQVAAGNCEARFQQRIPNSEIGMLCTPSMRCHYRYRNT